MHRGRHVIVLGLALASVLAMALMHMDLAMYLMAAGMIGECGLNLRPAKNA